ncbi:MAG TPA: hypothetical protein VMW36_06365 [Patescibacteria group bacterium]|nr:hypothetical protein [Patescibacteria group bacterium]
MRFAQSYFTGLIIVLAVATGFAFAAEWLGVFPTGDLRLDVTMMGLVVFSSAMVFVGLKKRQIVYFLVTLTVVGLILIMASAMIMFPYAVTEIFTRREAVDGTQFVSTVHSPFEKPLGENGSLNTLKLLANSTELFLWYDFPRHGANISLVQIDVAATYGQLSLSLVGFDVNGTNYTVSETFLYETMGGRSSIGDGPQMALASHFYWTPPSVYMPQDGGFVFESMASNTIFFQLRVTEFHENAEATREVTHYRSLISSDFAYVGIALIGSATVLDVCSRVRGRKSR